MNIQVSYRSIVVSMCMFFSTYLSTIIHKKVQICTKQSNILYKTNELSINKESQIYWTAMCADD